MIQGRVHCREYLDYCRVTIQLLCSYFDVVGNVAVHDYTAYDIHDDSEDKVYNNSVPKDCDVPWIFWSDTSESQIWCDSPNDVEAHEAEWKEGVIGTLGSIMPERPDKFKALIKHADLNVEVYTVRYPLMACSIWILLYWTSS